MTTNNTTQVNHVESIQRGEFVKPIEFATLLGIRAQQVYGYIRKGKLESVVEETTGKLLVRVESANAYVEARMTREADKAAKVAAELAEAEAETVQA